MTGNLTAAASRSRPNLGAFLTLLATLLALLGAAEPAWGWWNGEWAYRKKIVVDASAAGVALPGSPVALVAIPLRLTLANFSFADARPDGADLRFVAGDDATPLKFHIEKFSGPEEMAVVWVLLPALGSRPESIWMYHGNPKASPGSDAGGTYDPATAGVFHFSVDETLPRDSSAYGNHASASTARSGEPGVIGSAVSFDSKSAVVIPAAPSTAWAPEHGFTASLWLRSVSDQQGAVFTQGPFEIALEGKSIVARWKRPDGTVVALPGKATVETGTWHHVAVVVTTQRTAIYRDGKLEAELPEGLPGVQGDIVLGAHGDRPGFAGALDELRVDGLARPAEWIALAAQQFADSRLATVIAEEAGTAGSYVEVLRVLIRSVSLDGWVIIGCIVVLGTVAGGATVSKQVELARAAAADRAFLERFRSAASLRDLAGVEGEEPDAGAFDGSLVYAMYSNGVAALDRLEQRSGHDHGRLLKPHELQMLKSAVDQSLVEAVNGMNRGMVRLTLAISGAPFLGLLGTVVGIMITFGTIALVGDVNVNTIAPGVAAALTTTVAGLVVAIPVMFAYNHLGTKIREMTLALQVFAEDLVARLAADFED